MFIFQKILSLIKNKQFQIFFLIIITFLVYSNTLKNDFAWDDQDFIFNWFSIRDNGNLSSTLSLPYLLAGDLPPNHMGVYRPVRSIFYLISFKIFGTNPFGYHLQAIIIHTIAVLLIYFITKFIINKPFFPFITAILFATHPIHTESVSFITASFDTIGVVFLFVAFYCFLRTEIPGNQIKVNKIASYIYTFLAFFTYEMTLVLPFLIILYDWCFKKLSKKNWRSKVNTYIPYLLILFSYAVIRFLILRIGDRAEYLGESYLISSILGRLETPEVILYYIAWLTLPIHLTIGHFAPNIIISFLVAINNLSKEGSHLIDFITKIGIIIPITTVIVGVILALKTFSKNRVVAFGISWFLISLITVSSIFSQGTFWAERFLYLPSFGFSILTAQLHYYVYSLTKKLRYRKLFFCLIVIFLIFNISFYSVVTFLRNKDWKNSETLFLRTLELNPKDYLALNGLGVFYLNENKIDLAIQNFKKSTNLVKPKNATFLFNLAYAYEKRGDLDLAIQTYKESLSINPNNYTSHVNLASIYEKKGNIDLAIQEYKQGLTLKPNNNNIQIKLDNLVKQIR